MWLLALLACSCNGRNHPNSGNPAMEALLDSCTAGDWTVRLYQGQPNATVAFWSSVTVERDGAEERQILYAYATPSYQTVTCSSTEVVLTGSDEPARTLPTVDLERLRTEPLRYWRGQPI